MFRKAILSALLTIGVAGGATAQESGIKVLGTGENFAVDYAHDSGNILGGGPVQVVGLGNNARYLHAPEAPAERGWIARFDNQGENTHITYTPAPGTDTSANPHPQG